MCARARISSVRYGLNGSMKNRLASGCRRRFLTFWRVAPESALDEIKRIVPGLKSPTVVPLQIPGWVAVHMAIQEDIFWESIEQLRAAGATEILVSSLDKLLL